MISAVHSDWIGPVQARHIYECRKVTNIHRRGSARQLAIWFAPWPCDDGILQEPSIAPYIKDLTFLELHGCII